MQRRLVGPFVLVVCACLVAGCGSALQAKARKAVGDPHATVVSTETVRALNGARLVIVVLKPGGAQGLGCVVAEPYVGGSSNPPAYRCPRSNDAFVLLNPTTHADGGELGISRYQVAAIAKARLLSPRFQEFPAVNQLTVRCAIPHASPSGSTLSGMCVTTALPYGGPVRCVAFSEGWRPSATHGLIMRGWIVTFSRDGKVRSIRRAAHPPPRWDGHQPKSCSAI